MHMLLIVNLAFLVYAKQNHVRAYLTPLFVSYRPTEYGLSMVVYFIISGLTSVLIIYSAVLILSDIFVHGLGTGIASYSGLTFEAFLTHLNETFIGIDTGVLISSAGVSIGIENTTLSGGREDNKVNTKFSEYTCFDEITQIILCKDNLSKLVSSFWKDIFPLYKDRYILIQLRIKSGDNYYSLSKLQSVNYDSKEGLDAILNESLTRLYERYTQFPIDELFLRFLILPKGSRWEKVVIRPMIIETKHFESLSQINLPTTLDLTKWGKDTKLSSTLTTVLSEDGSLFTIESVGSLDINC